MNTRVNFSNGKKPPCFKQNGMSEITESFHERINSGLQERFSSGDLNTGCLKSSDLADNFLNVKGSGIAFSVGCIAADTAVAASREPNEGAGPAGK
jgi:hypothetical protein